jgi:hypothetical protein
MLEVPSDLVKVCPISPELIPTELVSNEVRFRHFLLWAACKNTRPHGDTSKAGRARAAAGPLGAWVATKIDRPVAGQTDWWPHSEASAGVRPGVKLPLLQTWAYHYAFALVKKKKYVGWWQPVTGMVTLAMHRSAKETVVPDAIVDPDDVDAAADAGAEWGGAHDTNTILSAGVNPRGHYDGSFTGAPWVWGTTGVDGSSPRLNKLTSQHRVALTAALTGTDKPKVKRFSGGPRIIHPLGNDPNAPATVSMCSILGTLSHESALASMRAFTDNVDLVQSLTAVADRLEQWPAVCRRVGTELLDASTSIPGIAQVGPSLLLSSYYTAAAADQGRAGVVPCFDSVIWWPGYYPTALVVPDGVYECTDQATGARLVLVSEFKTKWRSSRDPNYLLEWPTAAGFAYIRQTLYETVGVAMALAPRPDNKPHDIRGALIVCEVDDSATKKPSATGHPAVKSLSTFTRVSGIMSEATKANVWAQINEKMDENRSYSMTPTILRNLLAPGGTMTAKPAGDGLCQPDLDVDRAFDPPPLFSLVDSGTVEAMAVPSLGAPPQLVPQVGWAWHPAAGVNSAEPGGQRVPLEREAAWATLHYEALFFVYTMYDQTRYETVLFNVPSQDGVYTVPDNISALVIPMVGDIILFSSGHVAVAAQSTGHTVTVAPVACHKINDHDPLPGLANGIRMSANRVLVMATVLAGGKRVAWDVPYTGIVQAANHTLHPYGGNRFQLTGCDQHSGTLPQVVRRHYTTGVKYGFFVELVDDPPWRTLFPYIAPTANLEWWLCKGTSEVVGVVDDDAPRLGYAQPTREQGWVPLDTWVAEPLPEPTKRLFVELRPPKTPRKLVRVQPTSSRVPGARCAWEYTVMPPKYQKIRANVYVPTDSKNLPHYFAYDDATAEANGFGLIMADPKEQYGARNNSAALCALYVDAAVVADEYKMALVRWKAKRVASKFWDYAASAEMAFGWCDPDDGDETLRGSPDEPTLCRSPYRLFMTPTLPTLADTKRGAPMQWTSVPYAPPMPGSFDFPHCYRVGDRVGCEWNNPRGGAAVVHMGSVVAATPAAVAVQFDGELDVFTYANSVWCYKVDPRATKAFYKEVTGAASSPSAIRWDEANNTWITKELVDTTKSEVNKYYRRNYRLAKRAPLALPLKCRAAYFCVKRLQRDLPDDRERWAHTLRAIGGGTDLPQDLLDIIESGTAQEARTAGWNYEREL